MRTLTLGIALLGILAVEAVGQVLYDGGLVLVASLDSIAVSVQISNAATHCEFRAELLEAEVERVLRRDGIVARPDSIARLEIEVLMVPLPSRGCAAYVDTQLVVVANAEREAVLLAAIDGQLLTRTAPEHVGRIREVVEQSVSVIANAIRRARDEQNRAR